MWAKKNVQRQAHHLSPEHLEAPGWPVPLTTSRADLKVLSDRRSWLGLGLT